MADSLVDVDLTDFKTFARVLGKVERSLVKDLNASFSVAGEIIAADARRRSQFSSRIPGSIAVIRRGRRVRVRAGGAEAPHAAAIDNRGKGGVFRHPVFGNRDVWVNQPAKPFLEPTETVEEAAFRVVVAAVDKALIGISVG